MTEDERWLRTVLHATQLAIERLREKPDPVNLPLQADLERLRQETHDRLLQVISQRRAS
jgi:hypothetical protein